MSTKLAESLLNPYILLYIACILGLQFVLFLYFRQQRNRAAFKRKKAGLPDNTILNTAEHLSQVRWEATLQMGSLLLTVFVVPFVIVTFAPPEHVKSLGLKTGLGVIFLAVCLWIVVSGTQVAKSFLEGLAFKALVAFTQPLQVGDRVTLKGHGGKLLHIGLFYVTLQTPDDDQISIPTSGLWSDVLVSANAGHRSSLTVMEFYLASFVTTEQIQQAEDAIWDAIQASPYCNVAMLMQIYLKQNIGSIQLTAKAYVNSTYDEFLFRSDVTRAFLKCTDDNQIPLASRVWRTQAPIQERATQEVETPAQNRSENPDLEN